MYCRLFAILATLIMIATMPALAAKRVALVVGNNDYVEITVLQKAVNDARAMRDALQDDLGFEVVYGENQDQRQMNALINTFESRVEEGDVAFIYFSGHGVAIKGENFLTPTDIPRPSAGEESILAGRSFGSSEIIDRIHDKKAQAIFAVLDACRNNPFKVEGGKSLGGGNGLQKMDAAQGVFVLFAAGIGQEALDRISDNDENPNSVFTRVLIPLLKHGGMTQYQLAKAVQNEVTKIAATIGHKQNPAYYDQIIGDVILKDGASAPETPPEILPETPPEADEKSDLALNDEPLKPLVEIEWGLLEDGDDEAGIKAFLEKYPDDPTYSAKAKRRLLILSLGIEKVQNAPICDGVMGQAAGEQRCLATGYFFADCEKCPEVVVVPAGNFMMGSADDEIGRVANEGPQHEVAIGKALAFGRYEVTNFQYLQFADETKREAESIRQLSSTKEHHPVVKVSRADAQAYAAWLSTKTGLSYRLPTESEWEYAARAGGQARYVTGDSISAEVANIDGAKGDIAEAGDYAANNFGLFDMAGNVFEWTADCYSPTYENATSDGTAQTGEENCEGVNRGGSWRTPIGQEGTDYMRVAYRSIDPADTKDEYVGFRIVRDLE